MTKINDSYITNLSFLMIFLMMYISSIFVNFESFKIWFSWSEYRWFRTVLVQKFHKTQFLNHISKLSFLCFFKYLYRKTQLFWNKMSFLKTTKIDKNEWYIHHQTYNFSWFFWWCIYHRFLSIFNVFKSDFLDQNISNLGRFGWEIS